jgi:hypothetical protein
VWCRFDFGEALGSGVSRGVGDGVVSSVSPDSFLDFELRLCGDSCGRGDSLLSPADFSFAGFAFGIGLGDFLALGEESVLDSSVANFALGMAVAASSGVADARCFLVDLFVAPFAAGLGDFFGFGDDVACVSLRSA